MPPLPTDSREAVQWFVNTVGLYTTNSRGLLVTEFGDDERSILDSAVIDLRSRGIMPVVLDAQTVAAQAEHLWEQARHHTRFGRPLASQFELEVSGTNVLVLKDLDTPETPHHLWYLFHHVFFPRALAQKPTLVTTQLSLDELVAGADECEDIEFSGRKVTWRKLMWLLEATCVDTEFIRSLRELGLPPMLKVEHQLLEAVRERGLNAQPQFIIGDYMLDLAIVEKDRKVDIECDVLTTLDATGSNAWEAKKNLLLLSDGWKVLKFGNTEITNNVEACVDVVEEVWTQGRKRSTFGRLLSGQAATSIPELPGDDDLQRLAITHGAGPCAVEGGAGTGKTSCVVHRVAFLLSQGISPDRILVISHSQETVRTLKSAVELISDRQSVQRVSFHSWHDLGLKILKENLSAIKRKPPLKIEANPQKVIQRLLVKYRKDLDPTTLELSEELDEFTLASLISLYKANLISARHLKERSKSDVDELVAKIFQGYEDQLQKINRVDRDDMISLAAQVLVDYPDVAKKYQQQFDFVLVDEYQDATSAGDLLSRVIAAPQDNLYISGDEDESIYESKGGLPRLMADVSIRLPNARCYVLEKNWRSHPAIVDHSRQLIANLSRRRIVKDMASGWGPSQTGAIVGPQVSQTEETEAQWVAEEISLLIDGGRDPKDIAVLYRYHRYAIIIEEALSRRGIRCESSHPEAGLIPDEVGDVMAFLRLVMDPDGPKARESFERVCQLRVKEIDPKLFATIAGFAEVNNLSYLKAVEIYSEAVPDVGCQDLRKLVNILRDMNQRNLNPAETIAKLRRTQGLNDYYKSIKVPPGVNYEPLQKLAQLEEDAKKFTTVAELVKAQTAVPKSSPSAGKEPVEHVVHILTLHEAKGKEFAVVFLVGLAEGLFPADSVRDREEERRLCYVGMTRAKDLLYLSFPTVFNKVGLQPSSFLAEARLMAALPPPIVPPEQFAAITIQPAGAQKIAPPEEISPALSAPAAQALPPSLGAQASPPVPIDLSSPTAPSPPAQIAPEPSPPALIAQAAPALSPVAQTPPALVQATHVQIPANVPGPSVPASVATKQPAPQEQWIAHDAPPVPAQAKPVQPAPIVPAATQPADPAPIVPAAAQPAEPAPIVPAAAQPAEPAPIVPAAAQPAPAAPIVPAAAQPADPAPAAPAVTQPAEPVPAAPVAPAVTQQAHVPVLAEPFPLAPSPPVPDEGLAAQAAASAGEISSGLILDPEAPVQADLSIGMQQPPPVLERLAKPPFPSKGQGISRRVPRQQAPGVLSEDAGKTRAVPLVAGKEPALAGFDVSPMLAQAADVSKMPAPVPAPVPTGLDFGSAAALPGLDAGKLPAPPTSDLASLSSGAPPVVSDENMQRQYVRNLIQEVKQFDLFEPRSGQELLGTPLAADAADAKVVVDVEEALGPVQAALQRRNAKMQQTKTDSAPSSPEEVAPQDQYVVEADLSIAHEKALPGPIILKHGLPPSSRKQKAKLQDATIAGAPAAAGSSVSEVTNELPEGFTAHSEPERGVALAVPAANVVPPFKPPSKLPAGAADILASWDSEEEAIVSDHFASGSPIDRAVHNPMLAGSLDPTLNSSASFSSEDAAPAGGAPAAPARVPALSQSTDPGVGVFGYATADHDVEPTAKPKFEKLPLTGDAANILAEPQSRSADPPSADVIPAVSIPSSPPVSAPPARASAPMASDEDAVPQAPSMTKPPAAIGVDPIASDVEDLLAGIDLEQRPSKYKKYKARVEPPALPSWKEPEPNLEPALTPDTEPLADRPKPPRPAWAPPADAVIDPSQVYSPATPLPSSISHRVHCSNCAAELESGSRFCGECGTLQQSRIPACHLCGSPLEPTAKFCGECGSPRIDEAAPAPVPGVGGMPNMDSPEYKAYLAAQQKPTQKNWMVKLLKFLEQ